jgi:hypothetical protein
LVLIAVTAVALFGVTRVGFDDDLRNLFRSERDSFEVYDRFQDAFPDLENQVFLLVEGDDLVDQVALEAVRSLHLDLQFVDDVTAVMSIFTARRPPDANGDLLPVFPDDLPGGEALKQLVESARSHPLLADKMLSADGTATLLVLTLTPGLRAFEALSQTLGDIQDVAEFATEDTGVRVVATGVPVLRYEVLETIRSDLHFLNLVGAGIAVAICGLFFRRVRWVVLASVAPMVGVIWTLGGFGLVGIEITAMSNILPTLVLVIGFSDALHMVNSIRRQMSAGATPEVAIKQSVGEVGPACAMTTITTMIALISLTLSESAVVQEFGIAGALSVFAAFVAIMTIIPTLAVFMLRGAGAAKPASQPAYVMGLAQRASDAVWRGVSKTPAAVVCFGVVILLITGVSYFKLDARYDYREYLSPESQANLAIERINEKLGGADVVFVLVERENETAQESPQTVVDAVHAALEAQGEIDNVVSMASAYRWFGDDVEGGEGNAADALANLPEHYANRFASDAGDAWLVTGYVPAAPAPVTLRLLGDVEDALTPVRAAMPGYSINITGIVALSATESGGLIDGLKNSLTVAILAIILVIGITTGSPLLATFSIVPNLLSLTVVAAALAVFGAGFQFTSAIALTVAFGIAVDNTVHFIHRYRLERGGAGAQTALTATVQKVGPVLIAATAVLACGLLVTQVSVLPMIVLFGRLCMVILCAALLATMILLPALIAVAAGRFQKL